MRRYLAAGIDFIISYAVTVIVYCVMISGWKWIRILMGPEIRSYSRIMVMVLFPLVFIFISFIYTVIFDRIFCGRTPGKRMAGYKIPDRWGSQLQNRKWILKHSLLRALASLFYVITVLYYLKNLRMPYDRILWEKKCSLPERIQNE